MAAVKEYVSDNSRLIAEWHWERNTDVVPSKLTLGSKKKVWWKCSKGHEWQATVINRSSGRGCPYCSGRYAIKGENDLQSINPNLAAEWNYGKNHDLMPKDVLPNSNKSVWWKCNKGHEWQAKISNRNNGRGCPICGGQKVEKGYNDLQTVKPMVAAEWNYEKNGCFKPEHFTANSGEKVWWKCSVGHEWQARIYSRSSGNGCPYCTGRDALKGENDLQTVNPILAKEWNSEKNKVLTPEEFLPNSNKMVWWKCSKGHEWRAVIAARNKGGGCPICNSERSTSFPEYVLVFYLKKCGLNAMHAYKENGYELDVYIPSLKIAVEYDGYYWHKNRIKRDLEKNRRCKEDGIKLYRIREELFPLNDTSIDYVVRKDKKGLSETIENLLAQIIGVEVRIDIERDRIDIENLREYMEKEDSLLCCNPEIANEWHYEKNGGLRPEFFTVNSNKKVWWKCSKEHEWQATISDRNRGRGCPYCSGRVHSKILNVETGEVFESYSEAARKYKIYVTTISNCCKGKQKTAGGYHWKYFDEAEE